MKIVLSNEVLSRITEASVDRLSAPENFVTFPFLLIIGTAARIRIWERAAFANNLKSRPSEVLFKTVISKYFSNFLETIRGRVFLLGENYKIIYSYGGFLENFLKFFWASFLTGSIEQKIFPMQLPRNVF